MQHNILTSRVLGVRPEVSKFVDRCRFECCVLCACVSACFTPRWATCEEDENTLDFFMSMVLESCLNIGESEDVLG